MNNDSPLKAIIMVTLTALLCSLLVTATAVKLQPIHDAYEDLERNRFLVGISGLVDESTTLSDREVVRFFQSLDARIVNLDQGILADNYSAASLDPSQAATDSSSSVDIPANLDIAKLKRRSRHITIYFVSEGEDLKRVILPIYGQGMWSELRGFIALEADMNTIADITFYQQAETAGIGDQILNPGWQKLWKGRKLYDNDGNVRFEISHARVDSSSQRAEFHVDAISGATVTTDAVSNLVNYWAGPHGFGPFLKSNPRLVEP